MIRYFFYRSREQSVWLLSLSPRRDMKHIKIFQNSAQQPHLTTGLVWHVKVIDRDRPVQIHTERHTKFAHVQRYIYTVYMYASVICLLLHAFDFERSEWFHPRSNVHHWLSENMEQTYDFFIFLHCAGNGWWRACHVRPPHAKRTVERMSLS